MNNQNRNAFSDEQIRQMRLNTCKMCTFSACNGNQSNKCNIDTLTCTRTGENIIVKTNDIAQTCPLKYWVYTNAKIPVFVRPNSGCGCGH